MLGCVGRLGSDIAIQPGVVLAFSPWPCHRLCGSAQLRARISEDRAMPREAPPHRKRPLLRRGTTDPSNLFVSNLHNAPVCRDSSDSALFDCRKPLIGRLFALEAHGVGRPAHPLDRRRASTGRVAEIDSVVLHGHIRCCVALTSLRDRRPGRQGFGSPHRAGQRLGDAGASTVPRTTLRRVGVPRM
jgi:hypothetical protein